ncbi:hypothetical protein QBC35DRAFT_298524 [Podospora australis]|uniref:Infection structure specific protein n=1 Tax=Podospora australis TaxID=1536484 RepID=A0AAN6WPA0_9PEZI|nr:hypothetical protein QBC35DRAFT_298524 [Podospora australis]
MHTFTLVSAALAGASLVLASPAPVAASAPIITPAPLPELVHRAIAPRTHDGDFESMSPEESSCYSKYQSILTKYAQPIKDPKLSEYMLSRANAIQSVAPGAIDEICSVGYGEDPNIPKGVESIYKSYTNSAKNAVKSLQPEVDSLSSCGNGAVPMLQMMLITDEMSCKTAYKNYMAAVEDAITESLDGTATERPQTGATSTVRLATGSGGDATSAAGGSEETGAAEEANASSTSGGAASSSSTAGAAPRETNYMAVAAAAAMAVAGAMAAL